MPELNEDQPACTVNGICYALPPCCLSRVVDSWSSKPPLSLFAYKGTLRYDQASSGRLPGRSSVINPFGTFPWFSARVRVIGAMTTPYYYGRTVHFAASHRYYLAGHLHGPHATNARIMYAGALLYLLFLYFSIGLLIILLLPDGSEKKTYSGKHERRGFIQVCAVICATSWMASWLFWGGYLHLAGDL